MKLAILDSGGAVWVEIDYTDVGKMQAALTAAIPVLAASGIMTVVGNKLNWTFNGSQVEKE